jgi:tripartite-type tricarboxylate transporter receptor subunit TctC
MPGAGEVKMANWLYNIAPKDGTAIGVISNGAVYGGLFGNTAVQYDPSKFNWLGSLDSSPPVAVVWAKAPVKTANDLLTTPIVIGGAGAVSNLTVWPRLVNSLLGAQLKIVTGYVGSTGVSLAMESGEVQGMIGIEWDGLKLANRDWVEQSKIRVLMQFDSQRIDELPDVPTPLEFVKDERTRQVMHLFLKSQQFDRAIATPPGTPSKEVGILQRALAAMAKDPIFLADAKKINAAIDFSSGADVQDTTQTVYDAPKDTVARAREELQKARL